MRTDLLDLGTDALMALANPGFVKRAQKDVGAGVLPRLEQDGDGTVHALFDDGTRTSMAPGVSLRDAACSCSASGMCRHRVTLVLAYQASQADAHADGAASPVAWSPAFDDAAIAAAVTPQVLEAASRLALGRPVATVLAGCVPTVHLPMSTVRFFSSTGLAHARCDCQTGIGCAHVVLAAWACRQAAQSHPGVVEATLELWPFGVPDADSNGILQGAAALRVRQACDDWLCCLWRDGAAQPLLALEARYAALMEELTQLGWTWVREDLDTLWQILQALAQRSNRFDMHDLLAACANAYLRLQGALHADTTPGARLPASQILGIGQQGEVALDKLRLVSLGASCWQDQASEGVSIVYADPDTQAACVLERSWPRSEDNADPGSLFQRRLAGYPVRLLAAGQLVTKAARRRANASLELGSKAQQTGVLALSPKAWDDLRPPLKFESLAALLQHLRSRPPAGIRSGQAGANWHVLDLTALRLEHWAWDGARQTLFARWSGGDLALHASLVYQSMAPGAVDALARVLAGQSGAPRAIAGPVWREHGGVAIRPMSILTEQRAVVLALEPPAPQALTLHEMPLATSPGQALLREARYLLAQLLRHGLRHVPPSLHGRLAAQAEQLDGAGYPHAARLLRVALGQHPDGAALAALSGLTLLLDALLA